MSNPAKAVLNTTETKPGIYTTEFWVALFTNVVAFAQLFGVDLIDHAQNKYVLLVVAIVNGLYAVGRGLAKSSVAYTAPGSRAIDRV